MSFIRSSVQHLYHYWNHFSFFCHKCALPVEAFPTFIKRLKLTQLWDLKSNIMYCNNVNNIKEACVCYHLNEQIQQIRIRSQQRPLGENDISNGILFYFLLLCLSASVTAKTFKKAPLKNRQYWHLHHCSKWTDWSNPNEFGIAAVALGFVSENVAQLQAAGAGDTKKT